MTESTTSPNPTPEPVDELAVLRESNRRLSYRLNVAQGRLVATTTYLNAGSNLVQHTATCSDCRIDPDNQAMRLSCPVGTSLSQIAQAAFARLHQTDPLPEAAVIATAWSFYETHMALMDRAREAGFEGGPPPAEYLTWPETLRHTTAQEHLLVASSYLDLSLWEPIGMSPLDPLVETEGAPHVDAVTAVTDIPSINADL